ncbi:hypothetical protein [Hymenobacter sp. APR13]|uniref:hypothetical protein n=1 Tax=Hymenobacter sp. APR13 TaxID=1356852 RepID=UPI0004E02DBC|nr:hypothetical protein [Hymenobacter sp. APR13]AII52075.1 hypothetical protein N008_08795 [Hymenobacter sp. APR13]
MQLPNQRGASYRQQQPAGSPLAIRTKKHQLDSNLYTRVAMGYVWRKEWWFVLIPFVVGVLPAAIWPSWWWLASGLVLALLYVLLRSSQITAVTQVEQTKPLFERMSYVIDQRQIGLMQNEKEGKGMGVNWDMIGRVEREGEGYLLWFRNQDVPAEITGWRAWVARTFETPMFLHVPFKIFNTATDQKLFESMLRRKNLLPAAAPEAK